MMTTMVLAGLLVAACGAAAPVETSPAMEPAYCFAGRRSDGRLSACADTAPLCERARGFAAMYARMVGITGLGRCVRAVVR